MKRLLFTLIASLTVCSSAQAHDFWISPNSYQLENSGAIPISVMVGHPKDQGRWTMDPHRVISLKTINTNGIEDQQARIRALSPNGDMIIPFNAPGTHMIAIETTSAVSNLPFEKFNAYIKEEGLSPIESFRKKTNTENKEGREIYSRRGKALVQVGPVDSKTSRYVTRPVGMTLEIVPHHNPYALQAGEALASTTYYRGEPIKGVTIGLISLDTELGLVAVAKTNNKGEVTFERPKKGSWMLHAVWSDKLEDTTSADFDTVFSSLSFGFLK